MQIGFYFDQTRCIGCYTCVAACRSWNELGPEMPNLMEIATQETGEFPNLSLSHFFLTCFHCAEPACVAACPDRLLTKPKDGIVILSNPESCTLCGLCSEACPYGAIKVTDNKLLKCNLCIDRIAEGKAPACVVACPTEAIDVGPIEELVAKYAGAKLGGTSRPSIIIKEYGEGVIKSRLTQSRK